MILQALTEYYRTLENSGQISPLGWGEAKVSYDYFLLGTL